MKIAFFLILVSVLLGCSPLHKFNTKVERLREAHKQLENDSTLVGKERRTLFFAVFREGFPEYESDITDIAIRMDDLSNKKAQGVEIDEEIKQVNKSIDSILDRAKQTAYREQEQWSKGMEMLGESIRHTGDNIKESYEIQKPLNCRTHIIKGSLSDRAYTTCY